MMNPTTPIKRRHFLGKTIALTGLAPGLAGLAQFAADAPESQADRGTEAMAKLIDELAAQDSPLLRFPNKDGLFLNWLVKVVRAQNVLDIGTAHGYATMWMRLGLHETGGKLTTLEIRPERLVKAKAHLAKAGLSERVKFLEGDAHQIVSTLDTPFDFILLNADKSGSLDYFKKLYPRNLPPGGTLLAYSAIIMRESMEDYLKLISHHPDFDSLILSATMEDGFSVCYRRRHGP
jgi:predicted O-methyltransferase YrrM